MFGLGFTEVLVILVVALLVFGPEKLPDLARTLGRTMWQVRRAADEFKGELSSSGIDFDLRREMQEFREMTWNPPPQQNPIVIDPPQPAPVAQEPTADTQEVVASDTDNTDLGTDLEKKSEQPS